MRAPPHFNGPEASWSRQPWGALVAILVALALASCETSGEVLSRAGGEGGEASGASDGSVPGVGAAASTGGVEAAGGMSVLGGSDGSGGAAGGTSEYWGNPHGLALGDSHTCFLDSGRLFCFGEGGTGELGDGRLQSYAVPTLVEGATDHLAVTLGARFTCVLRGSGQVRCAGTGTSGQLGHGDFTDSDAFVTVELPGPAQEIQAGHGHVCARLVDSRLFCWGANAEGQLGQDDPFPAPGPPSALPLEVAPGWTFSSVGPGQGHTCAIRTGGSLYCWGRNSRNELGLGDASDDQLRTPQLVSSDTDFRRVRAGQHNTCALRTEGRLDCWGANDSGQLGLGDELMRDVPTLVASSVVDFDIDTFHACVLRSEGVACAGRGIEGALGSGPDDQLGFALAPGTDSATQVVVGRFHSCLMEPSGIACTGQNVDGRLGLGDTTGRSQFTGVRAPTSW